MTVSVSTTTELPPAGTPIFLVLDEGVNFRSRLESVDGDTFAVAAPLETAGAAGPAPGHRFDVFWAPPRTRVVMPTRLVAITDEAPYHWTLAPAGPARQSNRREYVRGGGGAAVRLESDDQQIEGALLDISEGGLRCWIDEPATLAPASEFRASVRLGAVGVVELSGTILTVRAAPNDNPGLDVVLTINPDESLAQMIRLYVRAWEINERNLRLG